MITRASCPSARSATGRAPTTSPKPPALTKCAHSEATKRTEGARGIVFSGEYEVVERRHNDAHDTLACNETRRDWDHEAIGAPAVDAAERSEEHTSELQSHLNLVCRLLLEKKKTSIPPCIPLH